MISRNIFFKEHLFSRNIIFQGTSFLKQDNKAGWHTDTKSSLYFDVKLLNFKISPRNLQDYLQEI